MSFNNVIPYVTPYIIDDDANTKHQKEKRKEYNKTYQNKIKGYSKLASYHTDREKILQLLYLIHPELINVNKFTLEMKIEELLQSLKSIVII